MIWNDFVAPVQFNMLTCTLQKVSPGAMARIRSESCKLHWLSSDRQTDTQQDPEKFFGWLSGRLRGGKIILTRSIFIEGSKTVANQVPEPFTSLSLPRSSPSGEVYPKSTRNLGSLLQKFTSDNPHYPLLRLSQPHPYHPKTRL